MQHATPSRLCRRSGHRPHRGRALGLVSVLVGGLNMAAEHPQGPPAVTEQRIDDGAQQALAVTIYHDNLALVKDQRRLTLTQGENRLAWRNVSGQIRPETALLSAASPGGPAIGLLEQNFDFDLLTPESLLKKYLGRRVQVIRTNEDGDRTTEDATVLATNAGLVLRYADRIETQVVGHLAFPDLPADLRDQPTLVLHLQSAAAGSGTFELSYLTGGLSWKADYVAGLGADGQTMDLNGWVTLTNASGVAYRQARLQLVAGELNQVRPPPRPVMMKAMAVGAAGAPPQQESLDEYHLYTVARPTDILNQQTKQVALLSAPGVAVTRELVVRGEPYFYQSESTDGWIRLPVASNLNFTNQGGSLGLPLPAGVIRVYSRDSRGNAQFIGEDAVGHTPKGETVTLKLGESFDVTARRKQTEFTKLGGTGRFDYAYEAAFAMELKNAKPEPVKVKVLETFPGDWKLVQESQPHTKEAANLASWQVQVPAEGALTLTWRAQVRY